MSSNFAFLSPEFRELAESAIKSERLLMGDARAANETKPDAHDYSEAETRTLLIDLELKRAGWAPDQPRDREYEVTGMPNNKGIGYVDYPLWGDDGKPLAVVEAKKTTADARVGQQQAKLHADCLEAMTNQRPIIFYTNGYDTWIWDDLFYPQSLIDHFPIAEKARTSRSRWTCWIRASTCRKW